MRLDTLVVGGGYTGFGCALALVEKGQNVLQVEGTATWGGLGETCKLSTGYHAERFYHHFFEQDKSLLELAQKIDIGDKILFRKSEVGFLFEHGYVPWRGVGDILRYKGMGIKDKVRLLAGTAALGSGLIGDKKLDGLSLNKGLQEIFGDKVFGQVWEPLIRGKFDAYANEIPLRWMSGRMKQRLRSRRHGGEFLGYIKGSLRKLTDTIVVYLANTGRYNGLLNTKLEWAVRNDETKSWKVGLNNQGVTEIIECTNIAYTGDNGTANMIFKNTKNFKPWGNTEYFCAICVIIESTESLSDFYWTNIGKIESSFCGFINQSLLTGTEEYGGIHVSYLTRYVTINHKMMNCDDEQIKVMALECLSLLTSRVSSVINMTVNRSSKAQVVTKFGFNGPKISQNREIGVFLGNMGNVYPDERSINNAIMVGQTLAKNIVESG